MVNYSPHLYADKVIYFAKAEVAVTMTRSKVMTNSHLVSWAKSDHPPLRMRTWGLMEISGELKVIIWDFFLSDQCSQSNFGVRGVHTLKGKI